ncbi:AAA-like domain-containing protein [Dendronalium sp. ChiSLP03b]|uniref:AAA-like domain-containing protein n=1 Tax=Dendronalium sp. ChiSLP03b TaxID=3075381 RepID=UPI002AD34E98|nr:AAA-like domain-containing protein [Dendronalium sp. ChiSLP03b]MDZ8207874.1 AAA-like domain-containing protein [Dendronalium sp. ChiSLP03b]
MKRILILTANPKNTSRLRLDEEVREIQAALDQSKQRDEFEIITRWAVRVDDLQPILLDHNPDIVHFSAHGGGSQGLALEDELGQMQLVSSTALAGLFKLFKAKVECVFLNACYSEEQAKAIHQHINCVVGMNQAIGDIAAVKFAKGFYRAIATDKTYKEAFEFGCNLIDLQNIPESSTPVIKLKKPTQVKRKKAVSASTKTTRVFISYRSQSPDRDLAQQFFETLTAAGHEAFMAGESIRLGENWPERIDRELEQSDYFLLLLSQKSATSEMVTEEVRRVKQLQDLRPNHKPVILPIRINFPLNSPLNYDLRGYLQRIQQREWKSSADTPQILEEILTILAEGHELSLTQEELITTPPAIESLESPPLPVAEPELPEGQVDLASLFYVERFPIEFDCYEAILKPGSLIRIKAPRQMGKTSLMARILHRASQQGSLIVSLSFQQADSKVFADLEQFLRWFCASVGRRLRLPNRLADYWDDIFGSKDNCTAYFEEYLLAQISEPLALGLDEVDLVYQHPEIASDFFGLLRAWHEEAKNGGIWKKLRLIIAHSTEVYIPMNINQSPFNVGLSIELPEFNVEQIQDLTRRHGLNWGSSQIEQLMAMVGGHPYLVRVALYRIARQATTLEELLKVAPTDAGPFGDHLRRHWWNLKQHSDLAMAMKQIVATSTPVQLEPIQAFKLKSMGLVELESNNVLPRFNLYRQYFRDRAASL